MKNRKIISIIPNLLTSIALLLGLLSIFNLVSENSYNSIWWSCVFIYSAAFIDFIDGKIARLLKNDSEFGMHYDSLADLISFGVAPSFLVYSLYLNSFDRLGIICCLDVFTEKCSSKNGGKLISHFQYLLLFPTLNLPAKDLTTSILRPSLLNTIP